MYIPVVLVVSPTTNTTYTYLHKLIYLGNDNSRIIYYYWERTESHFLGPCHLIMPRRESLESEKWAFIICQLMRSMHSSSQEGLCYCCRLLLPCLRRRFHRLAALLLLDFFIHLKRSLEWIFLAFNLQFHIPSLAGQMRSKGHECKAKIFY